MTMSGYLLSYAFGCASAAAVWWFWPRLTAAAVSGLRRVRQAIRAKLS
jgi:hypothetical protein